MATVTTTTMPLTDILNANPAWLRRSSNETALELLKADIARDGMKLPILITPDLLVIDGGRRTKAAKALGWTDIPVRVARGWAVVKDYFAEAAKINYPTVTLSWRELEDLYQSLKVCYTDERDKQRTARRRAAIEAKLRGEPKPKYNYADNAGYMIAVAELVDVPFADLRNIMDLFSAERAILKKYGTSVAKQVAKAIDEVEATKGSTSGLRRAVREVERGLITIEDLRQYAASSRRNGTVHRDRSRFSGPPQVRARYQHRELPPKEADDAIVLKFVDVVEQLGEQAALYGSVSQSVTNEDCAALGGRLQRAITNIHRLRRLLVERGANASGESE